MSRPAETAWIHGAYSVPLASDSFSIGEQTIRDAEKAGDLVGHWLGPKKCIFLHEDFVAYIKSLPTERPES
jgi:hypothetical protein